MRSRALRALKSDLNHERLPVGGFLTAFVQEP